MTRADGDEMLPTMRRLGEHLHAAARREIGPQAPSRHPRRLAALTAVALALCAIGVWAIVALDADPQAELVAIGRPVGEPSNPGGQPDALPALPSGPATQPDALRAPPSGTASAVELSLIARAPAGSTAFALGVYRSGGGEACAVTGRVQDIDSIDPQGQRFPTVTGKARLCGTLAQGTALYTARRYDGADPTTIVFGRAPAGSRQVTVRSPAGTQTAPTGPGRAFLLVYEGSIARQNLTVSVGRPRPPAP